MAVSGPVQAWNMGKRRLPTDKTNMIWSKGAGGQPKPATEIGRKSLLLGTVGLSDKDRNGAKSSEIPGIIEVC